MVDFSDILDKRVEDIESPKPVPAGQYRGQIDGAPKLDSFETTDQQTGEKRTVRTARFNVNLLELLAGDESALESAGGLRRRDGKAKQVQATYYLEEDALYRLKNLAKSCGIEGESLRDIFEQIPGAEVIVDVGLRPDKNDSEVFYNQVNKMAGSA